MIAKISPVHGRDMGGLVRYLFGPGRGNEHRDQRVIAAEQGLGLEGGIRLAPQVPADWARVLEIGQLMDDHRLAAGIEPPKGWVWHCALSLAPGERLDDEQWARVARAAIARLGFDGDAAAGRAPCRWIAVHHGPSATGNDHIHVAVNLVREDCRTARPGLDRIAMSKLRAELEREFGLFVVEGRAGRGLPGVSRAELERAKRLKQVPVPGRTAEPDRVVLARRVRAAALASSTEAEFVRRLKSGGVWVRPRYAVGGRSEVIGYSVALPPLPDAAGAGADREKITLGTKKPAVVWFGGGRLAADLTLPKLRLAWTDGDQSEALAEWAVPSTRVTVPGRAEQSIPDPDAWAYAAARLDAIRAELAELPADDPRWAIASRGMAGIMAALAGRAEEREPGVVSGCADALAWSAQEPMR